LPELREPPLAPVRALAELRDCGLAARIVVDGMQIGGHPSRSAGEGVEFSQFRSYQPGDDIRRVDWKLFGRSGRFFVREAERESATIVRIAVDASASMAYAEDDVSLLDVARVVAATLAVIAIRQGDAVALYPLSDARPLPVVPAVHDRRQGARLLTALARIAPVGALPVAAATEALLLDGPRGITVIISDLHERAAELRPVAARLAGLGHDVAIIHVVGRREREFDYGGVVRFVELETGRELEVDASAARARYLAARDADWREMERELTVQRISYLRLALDDALAPLLHRYLRLRARRP